MLRAEHHNHDSKSIINKFVLIPTTMTTPPCLAVSRGWWGNQWKYQHCALQLLTSTCGSIYEYISYKSTMIICSTLDQHWDLPHFSMESRWDIGRPLSLCTPHLRKGVTPAKKGRKKHQWCNDLIKTGCFIKKICTLI